MLMFASCLRASYRSDGCDVYLLQCSIWMAGAVYDWEDCWSSLDRPLLVVPMCPSFNRWITTKRLQQFVSIGLLKVRQRLNKSTRLQRMFEYQAA